MDRLWTPWRYAYVTRKPAESLDGTASAETRPGVPQALAAWPGEDRRCVFCNMIAAVDYAVAHGTPAAEAEAAAGILERGKTGFLVLNAFPYNSGHLMAVPYRHESSLAALPLAEATELLLLARRAESALRQVYHPDGINLGINLGEAAGAGVAHHLHIHGVPRWSGDTNFMTVVAETRVLPEMLADAATRLRAALVALPRE